jgi:hypothetical protein
MLQGHPSVVPQWPAKADGVGSTGEERAHVGFKQRLQRARRASGGFKIWTGDYHTKFEVVLPLARHENKFQDD